MYKSFLLDKMDEDVSCDANDEDGMDADNGDSLPGRVLYRQGSMKNIVI